MTSAIAEALCDTILYYQGCDSSQDYLRRIILFLYCISGVDLTYWYQYPQLLDESKQTELPDLISALFQAFVNKDRLSRQDIINLFLEKLSGIQHFNWHEPCSLSQRGDLNIWYGNLKFYIKLFQIWGMSDEKAYLKFENAFFVSESLTMDEYFSDLTNSLQNRCEQIRSIKVILDDLWNAKSVEEMKNRHPDLRYESTFSTVSVNSTDEKKYCLERVDSNKRHWKEHFIKLNEQNLISMIGIQEAFMALCANNLYFQVYSILRSVIDHNRYPDTLQELTDCASYCKLQMKMHIELGAFGSFSNSRFKFRQIQTGRECIQAMIDIVFFGKSCVIGKIDSAETKARSGYILKNGDTIHKYLAGSLSGFTKAVQDGIYYRILYYLHPEKRLYKINELFTPTIFADLIWSFFYAVFQIDFYMLRNNDHFHEWETIIHDMFSAIRNNRSIPEIKDLLEQYYRHFQIELDKSKYMRLTAEELLCLREADITIRGDKELEKLGAEELMKNIYSLFDRLRKTIDFIENLLEVRHLKQMKPEYQEILFPIIKENLTIHSKYNLYKSMTSFNGVEGCFENSFLSQSIANLNTHVIYDIGLQSLFDYIRAYRYYHSKTNPIEGNYICYITEITKRLLQFWKKLSVIFCSRDRINDMIQGNDNAGLMNCKEIKNLYRTVRNAYLFIRFEDWLDENLIIK